MKKKKSYTVFSSDKESQSAHRGKNMIGETSLMTCSSNNELLEEILCNKKVTRFNFKCWKSCNTLFYDEIKNDDEIWLIQCPKNTVDVTILNNANLNFDAAISTIKTRVNGTKEKLTVYSVDDFPSQVNLALPNRATKSFQIQAVPVNGQLIMQKNIKIRQVKAENENDCLIDLASSTEQLTKVESESFEEVKCESPSSTLKKKRCRS